MDYASDTGYGYRIKPTNPEIYENWDSTETFDNEVRVALEEAGLEGKAYVEVGGDLIIGPAEYAIFINDAEEKSYDPETSIFSTSVKVPEGFQKFIENLRKLDWIKVLDDEIGIITIDTVY